MGSGCLDCLLEKYVEVEFRLGCGGIGGFWLVGSVCYEGRGVEESIVNLFFGYFRI